MGSESSTTPSISIGLILILSDSNWNFFCGTKSWSVVEESRINNTTKREKLAEVERWEASILQRGLPCSITNLPQKLEHWPWLSCTCCRTIQTRYANEGSTSATSPVSFFLPPVSNSEVRHWSFAQSQGGRGWDRMDLKPHLQVRGNQEEMSFRSNKGYMHVIHRQRRWLAEKALAPMLKKTSNLEHLSCSCTFPSVITASKGSPGQSKLTCNLCPTSLRPQLHRYSRTKGFTILGISSSRKSGGLLPLFFLWAIGQGSKKLACHSSLGLVYLVFWTCV